MNWTCYNAKNGRIYQNWRVQDAIGNTVATIEDNDSPEQQHKKALLIAAAPAMAESLKNYCDECDWCGGSGREHETIENDEPCHVCGPAREILVKAGVL